VYWKVGVHLVDQPGSRSRPGSRLRCDLIGESNESRPPVPAWESSSALPDRSSAFFSALLTEQFVQQSVRGVTVSEAPSVDPSVLCDAASGCGIFLPATHRPDCGPRAA
jgi:hypothetical protein